MEPILGFAFPFHLELPNEGGTGGIGQATGPQKLKQNLIQIVLTGVSERVMRRDYGGGIRQFVHEPNNEALNVIVQHQIAKSVAKWEPRVQLRGVTVNQQEAKLIIGLEYVIRETQEVQTLSVPVGFGVTT